MSTISQSESQWYKEYIVPFQPMGRLLVGTDLRGTQCDRFGNGNLRLVGYGDSSGGYAFTVDNQDSAYAPSLNSSNLSNISNAPPRLTELQDYSGKWIDTITLHALDEFIEQVEAQSFIANTLRIFTGGQKNYRGDGTGNRNVRNSYTLVAEIPIPALTRADIPRSFTVKCGVYIPPAQNIYLGLAIPQPYTCSFEMWDLQANTQIGSGVSGGGGSDTVASGNELSEALSQTPTDTNFVLPLTFASATWVRGSGSSGGGGVNPPPPSTVPPIISGSSSPSEDEDEDQPEASSPSSPSSPTAAKEEGDSVPPPSEGGCTPIQDCSWFEVSIPKTQAQQQINLGDYTGLCPEGRICRGLVEFETSGTFVICCGPATFPPNNLGCSSLMKWSCVSGGICVEDVLGVYDTEAECQSAVITTSQSISQSYSKNFGSVAIGTYPFTVTPPPSVLTWTNVKVFLVDGAADDSGVIGASPSFGFGGSAYVGPTVQIGSGTSLSGFVQQAVNFSPCYINANLTWTGDIVSCP